MGQANATVVPKPVFRSSAIFPAFNLSNVNSRILFMGYWILKRHIREIAAVVSLRSEKGLILHRTLFTIQEAKTYRIELKELLAAAGISTEDSFIGSMEIEFFSTVNLVFPFPAVVINYYGPHFSSVVHTAQRIYNDSEDKRNNSQSNVPEAGFNLYADDDHEPFFSLINGSEALPNATLDMQFYNSKQELLTHTLNLGDLEPYQTTVVYPSRELDLKSFFDSRVGSGKIRFHLNWVFPRLVVGNIQHSTSAIVITHSYYDCSQETSATNYWQPEQSKWYPASLAIPCIIQNSHFTNAYFYPIYSPSSIEIDVEIYDSLGHILGVKKNALKIKSPMTAFYRIPLKELCKEMDITPSQNLGARIIARSSDNKPIPSRIKLGLDIGGNAEALPCNICTNLQPFNPALDAKPKSFKWAPLLADQPNATIWIMNSSPAKEYDKYAEVELTFFREKDVQTLSRKISLPPQGFIVIDPKTDFELQTFLENQIGWLTAISTNSYTTTYYFAESSAGVVGGDHGF